MGSLSTSARSKILHLRLAREGRTPCASTFTWWSDPAQPSRDAAHSSGAAAHRQVHDETMRSRIPSGVTRATIAEDGPLCAGLDSIIDCIKLLAVRCSRRARGWACS